MNGVQQGRETVSGLAIVLALAGSLLILAGRVQAAETDSTGPDARTEQNTPDLDATDGRAKSWWQQRLERRRARAEKYREQMTARQGGSYQQPDPSAMPLSSAALSDIKVSFKLDPRLTSGLYMGDRWVSPPTFSGIQEGAFTVEARAQGADAKGQPLDINPDWVPANPEMVTVSPARGKQVTITVHRSGESSLRVTVPGQFEEGSVSTELSIKAWSQGTALHAEISPGAATGSARVEQGRATVRNGWKFVDGDLPREEQSRPTAGIGWKLVDGDLPAIRQ